MDQQQAVKAILAERNDQDKLWPRDERRKVMYSFLPPHICLLEERLAMMRANWYSGQKDTQGLVEIAAIAIRALEEIQ